MIDDHDDDEMRFRIHIAIAAEGVCPQHTQRDVISPPVSAPCIVTNGAEQVIKTFLQAV